MLRAKRGEGRQDKRRNESGGCLPSQQRQRGEKGGEKNKLREGVRGGKGGYLSWGGLPAQHRILSAGQHRRACAVVAVGVPHARILHGTLLLSGAYARGVLPSAWVATYCCLNSAWVEVGGGEGVGGQLACSQGMVCRQGMVAWQAVGGAAELGGRLARSSVALMLGGCEAASHTTKGWSPALPLLLVKPRPLLQVQQGTVGRTNTRSSTQPTCNMQPVGLLTRCSRSSRERERSSLVR